MSSNPPDNVDEISHRSDFGTGSSGSNNQPSELYRPGLWTGNGRGNSGRQGSYRGAINSSGNNNYSGQDRFGRRFENSGDNNESPEPSRTGTWHGNGGRNDGPAEQNRRGGFSGYGRGNGGPQGSYRGVGNRGGNGNFSGQNRSGNGLNKTGNNNGFSDANRSENWSANRGGNGYMARYGGPPGSNHNGTWNQNGGANGGSSGPNRTGPQAANSIGNQGVPPVSNHNGTWNQNRGGYSGQNRAGAASARGFVRPQNQGNFLRNGGGPSVPKHTESEAQNGNRALTGGVLAVPEVGVGNHSGDQASVAPKVGNRADRKKEARKAERNANPVRQERIALFKDIVEGNKERKNQNNAERLQNNARWPAIRDKFEPKVWITGYNDMHEKAFTESIGILQRLEKLTEEDSKDKLLDLLVKTTFVELHLTVNGQQSSEKLFDSMKLALTESDTLPFKSKEDLDTFLKSMTPLFLYKKTGMFWRNTGTQSRRFCQYILKQLQKRGELKEENFNEDYECFKKTIDEKPGKKRNFAENEATIDFGSYMFLADQVPVFRYNKEEYRLYLNPDVPTPPLTLVLPIFAEILHCNNPVKLDKSRQITIPVVFYSVHSTQREICYGILNEIHTHTFLVKFSKNARSLYKTIQLVTGYIRPNSEFEHIEVYAHEPLKIDWTNNRTAPSTPFFTKFGKKVDADFESLIGHIEALLNEIHRRAEDTVERQ